jgi:hypothetical protein
LILNCFILETNFDVKAAQYLIREVKIIFHFNLQVNNDKNYFQSIKWRVDNDIRKLLDEEFPEFDEEYNVYLEGCDTQNRPVISVPVGDWDIRR